jgi:hypothetical protein
MKDELGMRNGEWRREEGCRMNYEVGRSEGLPGEEAV